MFESREAENPVLRAKAETVLGGDGAQGPDPQVGGRMKPDEVVMNMKIQLTCQCGHEQFVSLDPDNTEQYHCRECEKLLFRLHIGEGGEAETEQEESRPVVTGGSDDEGLLHAMEELMREFDVTVDELEKIKTEITDEDRCFYDGISDAEILRKKVWEYKNW